jgi:tetratricopeptide (TPR) repeat protein
MKRIILLSLPVVAYINFRPSRTRLPVGVTFRILRCVSLLLICFLCLPATCIAAQTADREHELLSPSVREALVSFTQRNYDEALKSFQKAVDLEPNNSFAHYGVAVTLANLRRWSEAIEPMRRVFHLNPHPHWGKITEQMVRSLLAEAERNAKDQSRPAPILPATKEPDWKLIKEMSGEIPDHPGFTLEFRVAEIARGNDLVKLLMRVDMPGGAPVDLFRDNVPRVFDVSSFNRI